MARGKVLREKFITRKMVQERRTTIFVFGDNLCRTGLGGQAKEIRGEPNTVGIPTKRRPETGPRAYFEDSDWDYPGVRILIESAFSMLELFLQAGFDVVLPEDGVGTGRAELTKRAPRIMSEIEKRIAAL